MNGSPPPSDEPRRGAPSGIPYGASGTPRLPRHLDLARGQLFAFFFFAAFLFLLYQLYRVLSSFLAPIVWAAIVTLVFYPLYQRVLHRLHGRQTLAALLLTTLVTTTILVPTVTLSGVVTREAAAVYTQLNEFVQSGRLNQRVAQLRASRPGRFVDGLARRGFEIDYGALVQRAADAVSARAAAFALNVAGFLLAFTIMVFTLFFFFRDGERMVRTLRDLIPMNPEHKEVIFTRLYETLSAVVRGMLVTALVQGLLTSLGLWVLGVPFAAFLGVVACFLSLIPFAGAAAVWVPCSLYLAFSGDLVRAAILAGYGTLAISMVDNVLRPLLIGGQARLPTLFLFFGILGGLEAYGMLGIFLGPVLLAIVVAFVTIYREQYADPETRPAPLPVP